MGSKAFFSFKSPYAGGLRASVGNGLETVLKRRRIGPALRLPADTYSDIINIGLPSLRERAGGEAVVLLISKCKITTIFADVPTNYGKIHVRFEKSAFCARNLLIHREKFSEGILQTDKLS